MGLNGPCDFCSDLITIGTDCVNGAELAAADAGEDACETAPDAVCRPINCSTCCVNCCCCCKICSRTELGTFALLKFPVAAVVCCWATGAETGASFGAANASGAKVLSRCSAIAWSELNSSISCRNE